MMKSERELIDELKSPGVAPWRLRTAEWVESAAVQRAVTLVIVINAIVLGLETDAGMTERFGPIMHVIDVSCLAVFVVEILVKLAAYRWRFFANGWNIFDFVVVGIALAPGAGELAVLRSLRVLRVFRLLTVVPSLRKVVAAFLHAIPGLGSVVAVMAVFFYTAAVMATQLFGETYVGWFGSVGKSLYTLFQIMTLESWSMGIVRPVMESHPWAWAFFVPFIMIATFTILNLFIGIIVSTMQELSLMPDEGDEERARTVELLTRIEQDLAELKRQVAQKDL